MLNYFTIFNISKSENAGGVPRALPGADGGADRAGPGAGAVPGGGAGPHPVLVPRTLRNAGPARQSGTLRGAVPAHVDTAGRHLCRAARSPAKGERFTSICGFSDLSGIRRTRTKIPLIFGFSKGF
jgi:hypothetical protein